MREERYQKFLKEAKHIDTMIWQSYRVFDQKGSGITTQDLKRVHNKLVHLIKPEKAQQMQMSTDEAKAIILIHANTMDKTKLLWSDFLAFFKEKS